MLVTRRSGPFSTKLHPLIPPPSASQPPGEYSVSDYPAEATNPNEVPQQGHRQGVRRATEPFDWRCLTEAPSGETRGDQGSTDEMRKKTYSQYPANYAYANTLFVHEIFQGSAPSTARRTWPRSAASRSTSSAPPATPTSPPDSVRCPSASSNGRWLSSGWAGAQVAPGARLCGVAAGQDQQPHVVDLDIRQVLGKEADVAVQADRIGRRAGGQDGVLGVGGALVGLEDAALAWPNSPSTAEPAPSLNTSSALRPPV
jgi:hypothetical protein